MIHNCTTLLAFIPCVVFADAGTPLLWATGFHMFLGNAILGVFEGWLLAKVFGLPSGRCIGLSVLANYFSAWLGMFIVDSLRAAQDVDIYNALRVTLTLVFITYVLTVILEWPFVAMCFRREPHWLARSVKASLLVQTVSYVLLFGGFWLVSGKELYTDMTVVPAEQLSLPAGVQVFFIADSDGDVYRLRQGESPTRIFNLKVTDVWDHLQFAQSNDNANAWDLVAMVFENEGAARKGTTTVVLPRAVRKPADFNPLVARYFWGWGSAPRIGAAANSPWQFQWSHWNSVGISGVNERTGEGLNVSFGTPLMGWPVWSVIHLPEEKVLFQLGGNQLCLLDVATKRIALVARGHGPVAAADEELLNQSPANAPR